MNLFGALLALAACTSALKVSSKAEHIEGRLYGQFMFDVFALELKSGGGVSEIIEAIDEITADLQLAQASADEKMRGDQETCSKDLGELDASIQKSDNLVTENTYEIDEVLTPRKAGLQDKAESLENDMLENRFHRDRATSARESDLQLYLKRDQEHQAMVESCVEAKSLLIELKAKPEGSLSLLQMKGTSKALQTVKKKFEFKHSNSQMSLLLDSFIEVTAASTFADQDTLAHLIQMVAELQSDIENSRKEAQEAEDAAQKAHEAYLSSVDTAYAGFEGERSEVLTAILAVDKETDTRRQTIDTQAKLSEQYRQDYAFLTTRCDELRASYTDETARRTEELETCSEVRELFLDLSSNMSGYLRNRVDKGFDL
mmetsp:Transcript_27362/g.49247  ORF Transcript_27362/g.49247 Transcript_27362/m.49247 type:complete len:373 (-) Transcript_27362:23-1141(-)